MNSKEYYQANKERIKAKTKAYKESLPRDQVLAYHTEYYKQNKEDMLAKGTLYYEQNKTICLERNSKYRKEHRAIINQQRSDELKENPEKRLKARLRSRLNQALKYQGVPKTTSSLTLIGCTPSELRAHLESKWVSGMNWGNYGFGKGHWVMDHILPCTYFNLLDPKEQQECFHYTNLQPLWFEDNSAKCDKLGWVPSANNT